MRVEVLRDLQEGGRPVNSDVGRHMAMSLLLFTEASLVEQNPQHPAAYASLLYVMMELAHRNGLQWSAIEEQMELAHNRFGGFNMCKVRMVQEDINDGSSG